MTREAPWPSCRVGILALVAVLVGSAVASRSPPRRLLGGGEVPAGTLPCNIGVVEYLSGGSKVNETVIPYSALCIKQHLFAQQHLLLPGTVSLHLKGLPKTGTTWVELFITDLLEKICDSGIYVGCESQKWDHEKNHQRIMELVIPGQEANDRRAAVIRFTVSTKHMLTYNVSCDHLTRSTPDTMSDEFVEKCLALKRDKIRNPVRKEEKADLHEGRGEEWRECVYRGPYSEISKCIPEYMKVVDYPWKADISVLHKASELLREGLQVNVAAAQRKYVATIRDPRDSAVSNAHFVSRMGDPNEYVMEKGCKDYITALALFYYWQIEVQGQVFPTLEIWYREAVASPIRQVVRTLEHIGLRAPWEMIQQTVDDTTAEAMRAMEENGELPGANSAGSLHAKTNKATYGTYATELNPQALELCRSDMERVLPADMVKEFSTMPTEEGAIGQGQL